MRRMITNTFVHYGGTQECNDSRFSERKTQFVKVTHN